MLTRKKWETHPREVSPFLHIDQSSITTEDRSGNRYYNVPGGSYPSVTTILGCTSDHSWLENWKQRVGAEVAVKRSRIAANRGTHLHTAIEHYLAGDPIYPGKLPFATASCMEGVLPLLENIGAIRYQETALWSHSLRMAGRVDLCAQYDGEDAIIDFKSSTRMKEKSSIDDYFIQAAAYSYMIEELTGVAVRKLVIIMGTEDRKGSAMIGDRIRYRHSLKLRLEAFHGTHN